jgi:RHS repeat-associated protein
MSYFYDEDGTLIADTLTGGATTTWGQSARYIYLPTASGPMPVAAIYGTKHYAIQSDHLNTPRRLVQSDGQVAWQWSYSAFGDEQPTIAKNRFANTSLNQSFGTTTVAAVTFNLRYPGQYYDAETGLHFNWHRSLDTKVGRYTQTDPIDLQGGWNRFAYVDSDGINRTDPTGLAPYDGDAWTGSQLGQINSQTNCYGYALDSIGYSNPNNSSLFPRATCENLISNAKKDGLIDSTEGEQCGGACPSGYHKVQIFLDDKNIIDRDYHVYRQDDHGGWSHKRGRDGRPDRSDSASKLLICPINAPKDYVTRNYTQYCGTLCARETGFTKSLIKDKNKKR